MSCLSCLSTEAIAVGTTTERIETVINTFALESMTSIHNITYDIHIDGYDTTIFGPHPRFEPSAIWFKMPHLNINGTFPDRLEHKCLNEEGDIDYFKYTNPDTALAFRPYGQDMVWTDIPLEKLPHPQQLSEKFSFTYVVVFREEDQGYHIRYGRIINSTEIGVKHSILAGTDWIIVAGEIAIRKQEETDYEYIININSSKMKRHKEVAMKLIGLNVSHYPPFPKRAETLYYILMINLAYRIIQRISDPLLRLRLPRGMHIQYDQPLYESESATNEYLVSYYQSNIASCPSEQFRNEYNRFGELHPSPPYGACLRKRDANGMYPGLDTIWDTTSNQKVIRCSTGKRRRKWNKKRRMTRRK